MAHVTKISAGKSSSSSKSKTSSAKTAKTKKAAKPAPKAVKAPKANKAAKPAPKTKPAKTKNTPRVLIALSLPFRALGRYLRDSWKEIRQVRWPNRKATWKLVLAVFAYTAIFMIFIMLLDALFTFVFNNILG